MSFVVRRLMHTAAELIAMLRTESTCDDAYGELCDRGVEVLRAVEGALLRADEDVKVREACAQLLGHVVPEGVERLLELLAHGTDEEAELAAWGLRFHFAPKRVEPSLFGLLASRSDSARCRGARALRYIGIDLRHLPPVVAVAARDPVAAVRADILRLLADLIDAESGLISSDAAREIALLGVKDAHADVQEAAELLLGVTM